MKVVNGSQTITGGENRMGTEFSAPSARENIAHGASRGRETERPESPRSGRKRCVPISSASPKSAARYAGSGLLALLTHGLRRGLRSAARYARSLYCPFHLKEWETHTLSASALLAAALLIASIPACAQYMHEPKGALTQNTPIPILQQVGIDQRIGQQVPLDLIFRDETGKSAPLRSYFGRRPVLLTLVYYQCPMLCSQVLNGVVGGLLSQKLSVGRDFDIVTVSFDPRDTPADATEKRNTYLKRYGRAGAEKGWHFLTGEQPAIEALTKAVGFRYAWDPKIQQYAHASGIMVATADGRLSHYLYGIEYTPKDMRLALVESSEGKLGNVVDQVMLYCYHYDPATGKYGAVVTNMLRLGGALTLLLLGGFLAMAWQRELRLKTARVAARAHKSAGRAGRYVD